MPCHVKRMRRASRRGSQRRLRPLDTRNKEDSIWTDVDGFRHGAGRPELRIVWQRLKPATGQGLWIAVAVMLAPRARPMAAGPRFAEVAFQ